MNNNRRWLFHSENGEENFSPLFVTSINNLPNIIGTMYNYEATSSDYTLSNGFAQYMQDENYDADTPFVGMFVSSGNMRNNYTVNGNPAGDTDDLLIVLDYTLGIADWDHSEGDAPWAMEWIKDNLELLNENCEDQASYIFGGFVNNNIQK